MRSTNEEWRPVRGWEEYYEVSSLGRVRRTAPGCSTRIGYVLRTFIDGRGYSNVQLCRLGFCRTLKVARLVAMSFLPNFDAVKQVDHINGCKTDNRPPNLRPASGDENAKNKGIYKNNSVGSKGVTFRIRTNKFEVRIQVDKRRFHLGEFHSLAEATATYKAAELAFFGAFARGNHAPCPT